ncbi:unnamed protein product [Ilex paraguariensis]|uniref:MROH2B-like N-terminal HEAT-repeats domain-containing protein n=1 Tax=Ilex paraguariensis TaxID=185542 RepID=A0ABC8SKJ7_9AQUA
MASSSSGNSIPAPGAVEVLVSLLADESPIVREASIASLKDITSLNPLLVLDCCSNVSRGGRRRFGNMAAVFQVMSGAIRGLDKREVDPDYMAKIAKIATSEVISSKELNADWQRAAAGVLVAIGSHLPDLACWQYDVDFPLFSLLDGDVISFLNSAFELLLRVWATSRDLKAMCLTFHL